MEFKVKRAFTSFLLIWLHSFSFSSEKEIYLSDMVAEIREEWMQTYITAIYSLCTHVISTSELKIRQGNLTIEPILQRNKTFCCLVFDCFEPYVPTSNCSNRLQSLQYSVNRQYLEYTICLDAYKYHDDNYQTNKPGKQDSRLFGHLSVGSCPKNTSSYEHSLCTNVTNDELQPLTDTIPVTANDVHFTNRFCASCHGFKSNYKFWDLKIQCADTSKELYVSQTNISRVIKERKDCFLQHEPPPVLASTLPMCQLRIIRSCNVTGGWTNYNKIIEDLCLHPFIERVYSERTGRNEIKYKNVFCAICNGISKIGSGDCMFPQDPPALPPDFDMLISFNTEKSHETVEETLCPLRHIFIPLVKMCMKTHCSSPMPTDILHNTCSSPSPITPDTPVRMDSAYKVRLDTVMALSLRHDVETAILASISELYNVRYTLMFAYELQEVIQNCTDDVEGHFDVVYCHFEIVTFGTQHQEALNSRKTFPSDKSITINGTAVKIQFLQYVTDPSFTAYGKGRTSIEKLECFHNPYSNAGLIMFPLERYWPINAHRTYSISYMDCPSSVIPLQLFHIERYERGLRFLETDVIVSFNDFKTFNSTHVFVCQETLLAMKIVSKAVKMTDGYRGSIVLLLYIALHKTVL